MTGPGKYRRRAEEVTAVRFNGINAEECRQVSGLLVYDRDDRPWYLSDGSSMPDELFTRYFEPVPVPADDGWQPIETAPKDGRPLLFWLEKPSQKTQVHSGFILPNISVIGGHFAFDMPRALYWRELPPPPGALGRSK